MGNGSLLFFFNSYIYFFGFEIFILICYFFILILVFFLNLKKMLLKFVFFINHIFYFIFFFIVVTLFHVIIFLKFPSVFGKFILLMKNNFFFYSEKKNYLNLLNLLNITFLIVSLFNKVQYDINYFILYYIENNFLTNFLFNKLLYQSKLIICMIFIIVFFFLKYIISFYNLLKTSKTTFFIYIYFFFLPILFCNLLLISSLNFFISFILLELQFLCFIGLFFNILSIIKSEYLKIILQFFFLNCIASLFILFGFILIYSIFFTTNLSSIFIILKTLKFGNINLYLSFCILLIFIGFSFKLGFFPFIFWLPDLYKNLCSYNLIFYSTIPKFGYMFSLLYLFLTTQYLWEFWFFLIIFVCLSSIIISTILALFEFNLKSLIAFSSINYFSTIFLTFLSFNEKSLILCIFYFTIYILINTCIFFLIFKFEIFLNKLIELSDFVILYMLYPFFTGSFIIFFLVLSGLPPMAVFILKFLSIFSFIYSHIQYFFIVLYLIFNIISIFYYLRLLKILLVDYFFFKFLLINKLFKKKVILNFIYGFSFILFLGFLYPLCNIEIFIKYLQLVLKSQILFFFY